MFPKIQTKSCQHCARVFRPGSRGRPPIYCSQRCQQDAWRQRTDSAWRTYFIELAAGHGPALYPKENIA